MSMSFSWLKARSTAVGVQTVEGMLTPTFDVKRFGIQRCCFLLQLNWFGRYFGVGALTNIGATASATSTPDYNVTSVPPLALEVRQSIRSLVPRQTFRLVLYYLWWFSKAIRLTPLTTTSRLKLLVQIPPSWLTRIRRCQHQKIKRIKIGGELVNSGAGSANGSTVDQLVLLVRQAQTF